MGVHLKHCIRDVKTKVVTIVVVNILMSMPSVKVRKCPTRITMNRINKFDDKRSQIDIFFYDTNCDCYLMNEK